MYRRGTAIEMEVKIYSRILAKDSSQLNKEENPLGSVYMQHEKGVAF
jgi:hypothetical protein